MKMSPLAVVNSPAKTAAQIWNSIVNLRKTSTVVSLASSPVTENKIPIVSLKMTLVVTCLMPTARKMGCVYSHSAAVREKMRSVMSLISAVPQLRFAAPKE